VKKTLVLAARPARPARAALAVRAALAALAALGLVGTAFAQTAPYPNRTIRLVIGFAPGGAADYVARSMSEHFSKALGQQVVVDNKPGAGSSVAADLVAKAPPDGYTLLIASPSSISVNPALNPKLGYTPKDLMAVTKMTTSPLVLAVNPATGIKSVAELIALGKKDPGKLNYATSGNGSAPHLGAALFSQITGVEMTHVPYRGGAPAIQSVIAGDTQVTFGTSPSVLPMVPGGRLRALAVSTVERSPLVPDLPGMKEAGLPEYNLEFWYGLFVPVGTPAAIVKKLHDATVAAMQQPAVKAALEREGTEVSLSGSPEAFDKFLVEDSKFWVNLVKSAKVKVD
jgi:tripartite-type tricarboxylate transporter receptor subunit TctC